MNLLTYSSTIEKKIHGNSEVYTDALLKKIQGKLKNLQISSEITNDTLPLWQKLKTFFVPVFPEK